jgi:O-antigen ligase
MLKGKLKTPKPVILLIIAFLCPTEFSLYIAGLRIPPHRLALILLFPLALWRLLAQKNLKIRSFDIAFLLFNIWTVGIFTYHHGDPEGLVYGGSLALDGMGAFLVARTWIRGIEDFHATLRTLGFAIAISALIALPETLLGHIFTHDALKALTGYTHPTAEETRMHLTRAYGTFDHPIHYGTFCAALLSLFWYAAKSANDRRKRALMLMGATFLGLSSAPMLCLALQGAMLAWEKLTRGTANRTGMTLAVLAGLYIGATCVMSRSPIDFIATGMTLDSWTGYYRLQIWEHGLENVYASPWVGIGLNDWVRPWWMASSTIDAFWLVIGLREGAPAFLLIAIAIVLNTRAVVKRGLKSKDLAARRLARGWIMSLIALCLIGVTVHFWNVLYSFFFFFMGMSGWLADPAKSRSAVKAKVAGRAPVARPPMMQPLPHPAYARGYQSSPLAAPM